MNKPGKKAISFILSAALLLSCLPITALASESPAEENIINAANDANSSPTVIGEVTEKRKANKKVFRLSDGSYMSAEYPQPIHFEENGQLNDYDNTLIEEESEETNEKMLVNSSSDIKVRLSKKNNGKKFVRVEKDGHKLSWYYLNAKKSTAEVKEDMEASSDKLVLDKLTSTVLYKNVYKNVDLEYVVLPTGLKENIILKNNTAQTMFKAEYKSNGLVAEQLDEKTIVLKSDDGETVYTISAPFMEDADGAYCENVSLKLESIKSNAFSVIISLDRDWLLQEERAYPVLVDPVLKTNQDIGAAQSAFVSSANPNKCYLATTTDDMGSLYVGNISGFGQTESYIKFTSLPALGIADKVIDARVYLALRKCEIGLTVNIKQLTTDWDPYTVKWNNKPSSNNIIKDYMALTEQTDTSQFQSVEITDLVRGWYSGEYPNYGISLSTDKTTASKAWFYSIHYTGYTAARPVMTVTYRNMSGYENYWSYTDLPAGRSGTASVNNYNGNFIFTQPLFQDGGNLMPVELSLVYNSNGTQPPYTLFRCNVQTNYHIYIRYDGANAANGYKYYLNDSDGTRHWFYFESGSTSGKDEDGLGYTLYEIAGGSDSNEPNAHYKIADADGNLMFFDYYGNVIRIQNCSGVSSTVQYEAVGNIIRIKTITDGAGRQYSFAYVQNSPELCIGMHDPSGRYVSFLFGYGSSLSIFFNDNKSISLRDNSGSGLTNEITGIDGNKVNITYDNSSQHRVTEFRSGTDTSILEKYSFIYKQNETKVTDNNNRTLTYQFNDFGQTTGIVSEIDGTAEFFEYEKGNAPGNAKANKLLSQSRAINSITNHLVNPGFTRNYTDGYWEYVEDWNGVNITTDQSRKNITDGSLMIRKETANNVRANIVQSVYNLPMGTYTASCYINTNGAEIPGEGNLMFAEVWQADGGNYISYNAIEKTVKTDGWERRSVTFSVENNCQVRIVLGLGGGACGTVWFDDLQLEKGGGEGSYNIVENSAMNKGTSCWSSNGNMRIENGFSNYSNSVAIDGDPNEGRRGITQILHCSGKAGDVYSFGAWIKANSVPAENVIRHFRFSLHYYDTNGAWVSEATINVNCDVTDWQFVSSELIVPVDYSYLTIHLIYFNNANSVSMTGAFCYKEEFGQTYTYDSNGNTVSSVDLAKTSSEFAYYGNQMAQMLSPTGSKYLYNYNSKKQLYSALSSSGQEYNFTYDDKGNLTRSEISARKPASTLESGKKYVLVNAYSGLAIDSCWTGNLGDPVTTYRFTPDYADHQWELANTGDGADIYAIRATKFENRYLDVCGASEDAGTPLQIWSYHGGSNQKFKLVRQSDNTFVIYTGASNYTRVLDGQVDVPDKVVQSQSVKQADCNASNFKTSQKWYFYPVEQSENKKIITSSAYTASQNFLSSSSDQRGNTTSYSYNEQKGTLTSTTDPKGNITSYTYHRYNDALLSVSSGGVTVSYTYENDRLKSISAGGLVNYGFNYDAFGRRTAVTVGGGTLSETAYDSAGRVSRQTYGNGNYIDFTYDNLDRITSKVYNGDSGKSAEYLYGNTGLISNLIDRFKNTRTKYTYDLANRLVGVREYSGTQLSGNILISSAKYNYEDKTNRLSSIVRNSLLGTQEIGYVYGNTLEGQNPDAVYTVKQNGIPLLNYAYDPLGRLSGRTLSAINKTQEYSYAQGGYGTDSTTTLVESVTSGGITTGYVYDQNGNITELKRNGETVESYTYDSLNQLKTVTRNGVTTEYTYSNGNITEVKQNGETVKSYAYGNSNWRDLLTEYNGQTITYDQIGNPLTYRGKNITWQNGRRLAGITDENNTIAYAYDADGNRISKTVNGVTTDYIVIDGTLVGEITGENKLAFLYDESGTKYGFVYNGATYFYNLNLQGDVVGIYDSTGAEVVTYTYDEWGKILYVTGTLAGTIGQINPIRYRGYYYDNETGFYYLQSRYFDPETGRFLNADGYVATGQGVNSYNMFIYCGNNPINRCDPSGNSWISNILKSVKNAIKKFARAYSVPSSKSTPKSSSYKSSLSIRNFKNSDGSYSLYDNRRHNPQSVFHEQILSGNVSKPSFSLKNKTVSLGSASATFMTGGWETEHFDLSLLDIGQAKLAAEYRNSNVDITAMASAWAPSATIVIWDVNITLSAHVGSIGFKADGDKSGFDFGAAWGYGASVSVDW